MILRFWWVRKRIHRSYVLVFWSVGLIIGVASLFLIKTDIFYSWVWLLVALVMVVVAFVRTTVLMILLAVLSGLVVGAWRSSVSLESTEYVRSLVGKNVEVSANVFDDPDDGNSGIVLRLNDLRFVNIDAKANMYVTVSGGRDIRRGDDVLVEGTVRDGFGSFAGSMFRAQILEINRPAPGDVAGRIRDSFGAHVSEMIPDPEADLGLGYLLGQRRALPESMVDMLQITGLTHIVVASGYNLTVLVRFVRKAFKRVSRFTVLFVAGLLIISFMAVTGFGPSIMRAGLVSGLSLIAWYFGRRFHPIKLLLMVAAMTLLLSPSYIVDIGWLLSFAAFVGVMIMAPLTTEYFYGKEKIGTIKQILIETASAYMCTLPILIFFFSQFSILSIFANMLVLPTIPFAMAMVFMAGVSSLILPFITSIFGFLATMILRYNISVMEFFGGISWALREVEIGIGGLLIFYVIILGMMIYMKKVTKHDFIQKSVLE
jgi:ComEC/Rec2-related protein